MPYLDAMAAALEENQALSRKIGHALPIDRGLREFARVMEENMLRWPDIPEEVKSEPAFAVRIQFFLGGIINTFLLWEKGQLSCSREVVCQQIAVMIRQSASSGHSLSESIREALTEADTHLRMAHQSI